MEPILSMFLRGTANRVLANAITGNVESSLHTCLLLSHLRQGDDSGKLVALRHLSCGDGYENEDEVLLGRQLARSNARGLFLRLEKQHQRR